MTSTVLLGDLVGEPVDVIIGVKPGGALPIPWSCLGLVTTTWPLSVSMTPDS